MRLRSSSRSEQEVNEEKKEVQRRRLWIRSWRKSRREKKVNAEEKEEEGKNELVVDKEDSENK